MKCYICGADEYGTVIEVRAKEEGFNIEFDNFGRISTPNPHIDDHAHTSISQHIFFTIG